MGSKQNLVDFIFEKISDLEYDTVLDAFAGSGVIAYEFKKRRKQVTTNDFLHFSYVTSKALVENNDIELDDRTVEQLLRNRHDTADLLRICIQNDTFQRMNVSFLIPYGKISKI